MNNELYHHGIKGQKWGVKNGPPYPLVKAGRRSKKNSADEEAKKAMRRDVKNRRLLSDAEIKQKIERIQNQKKLKDLTEEELSPGRHAVKGILSSSGKRVASTVTTGASLYAIKVALTKKFDPMEAAAYVAPRPKNK